MSKYHKIRWNDSDLKELKRVVTNFNAKITRLAKKDPRNKSALPEKMSVAQLKELINTRQDLKRELNALKRFSKRGAEEIVVIPDTDYNLRMTKWQKAEMNRRVAIINRRRQARLEQIANMEMTSAGEKLGYTRGQLGMGKITEIALRPMTAFYRTMGQYDARERFKSILTQSQSDFFTKRDYQTRDNFIKGLKENYNYNNIKETIEEIEKMDIREFLDIFEEEGGTFEFASPNGQLDFKLAEYEAYEEHVKSTYGPNRRKRG